VVGDVQVIHITSDNIVCIQKINSLEGDSSLFSVLRNDIRKPSGGGRLERASTGRIRHESQQDAGINPRITPFGGSRNNLNPAGVVGRKSQHW